MTNAVTLAALAVALVASSGLAAHYHRRAVATRADVAQARNEIESLKHQLLLKQPNAPDVVLDFSGPEQDRARVGMRRLEFEDGGDGAAEETNSRIQQLEAALLAKDRQLAALQAHATNRLAASGQGRSDRPDRMAEFQRTDPVRYQEMVDRREAARKEMRDAFARQAAHLLEDAAAGKSDAEQQQRQTMLKLVADTWQMAEQLYSDTPTSNRWDTVHAMRQNIEVLTPLLDSERNRALSQLALESGYTAQDSAVFVDYINQVMESTSTAPLYRAMRHGAHGGGWRGGPPPGPSALPGQPPVTR
ncbi:MAG: hypothetical protein K8T26_08605 [Lentisphaerae bacterium]|nr:hypothetical protein [Lentisphaerota bacterium]